MQVKISVCAGISKRSNQNQTFIDYIQQQKAKKLTRKLHLILGQLPVTYLVLVSEGKLP